MKKRDMSAAVLVCGLLAAGMALRFVPGVRFSSWLCFGLAGLCVVWLALSRWAQNSQLGRLCKGAFAVLLAAVVLMLGCFEAAIIWYGTQEDESEQVEAVVVLGAGVNGTTPSLTLQSRIDAAACYLKAHPEIPAVLSGGQGPGEAITEAQAMYHGLVAQGIAPERLLLEERSTNTRENLRYSITVLEENGFDTHADQAAIVTNDFHALRAVVMNQDLPLHRVAVRAELPWWWLTANYYVREAFALVKTLIFD